MTARAADVGARHGRGAGVAACGCAGPHRRRRRVVLTGGPGAGKTAVLELVRRSFCEHVSILPEAAGIVLGGGFPQDARIEARRAVQRAIYFVQRELEAVGDLGDPAIVLCDRGTVDGAAYWPGPDEPWVSFGTNLVTQLTRYQTVIHLRTPGAGSYNHDNPLRIETPAEAAVIDMHIARLWSGHPRLHTLESTADFLAKAARALEILSAELPACCRTPRTATASAAPGGQLPAGVP